MNYISYSTGQPGERERVVNSISYLCAILQQQPQAHRIPLASGQKIFSLLFFFFLLVMKPFNRALSDCRQFFF